MVRGTVTPHDEAVVPIAYMRPDHSDLVVRAVLDTGFNGCLALPERLIRSLRLTPAGVRSVVLADGREVDLPAFVASVMWDGEERHELVLASEGVPLLGVAMLRSHRIMMDVRSGGDVAISSL